MRRILLALLLIFPMSAMAQTIPDRSDPHLIDLGDMLADTAEATLRTQLERLAEEQETEMVVLTLPSIAEFAGVDTVEDYASRVFDTWAIGDAERNDGILLVIFAEDRELRMTLGAGYDGAWNGLTAGIIQYRILPAFRDGDPALGISTGIDAVRAMIVEPFRADQPVPEPITSEARPTEPASGGEGGGGGRTGLYIIGGIVAGIAGLIGLSACRRKARLAALVCESCGHQGLEERTEVTREATETEFGEKKTITACPACGHESTEVSAIPKRTRSKPEGGKSGGGGAGGSW